MIRPRLLDVLQKKIRIGARLLRARLPERLMVWLLPADVRYDPAKVPPPIEVPIGGVRLLIGPANFAGQGYAWARAAERIPGVGAVNMQYRAGDDFGFPADYEVPKGIWTFSRRWRRRQRREVGRGFTHVLFEAEKSPFGATSARKLVHDVNWLRKRGVAVGMISHGTDIRLPSRHAQIDEFSPFRDADPTWVTVLESRARANHAVLDRLRVPEFVSTPEMLLDRSGSTWLPVVVEPLRWRTEASLLAREKPIVLHAPTNPIVKGTGKIEPILETLDRDGAIDYRRVVKVSADLMPALYAESDIVLEQFALGMYSVTAVEAMAAGRLVIAHVHQQVRDHVRDVTGWEIPVVSATSNDLADVLHDVRERREHYRSIARRGPAFVDAVHDGEFSARVFSSFLGVK